jgi:hypothetical protein
MINKTLIKTVCTLFLIFLFNFSGKAQVSFGAGVTGYKFLTGGIGRPIAIGLNGNAAIEFNNKSKLLLSASFFLPTSYIYDETLNMDNVPTYIAKTDEQLKTIQVSALYACYIIGNNKGGGLYAGIGPSVVFYNSTLTRENYTTYNWNGDFRDYCLDGRVGVEIPLLLLRIFAEAEIVPKIVSDFPKNNVSYSPGTGTILAGTVGVRIRL